MKKLNFIKVNPAGNITILIDKLNINEEDIMTISEILMKETSLHAEQVGFIKESHLQMMGGEFCGNASRAFASLLAFRDKNFKDQKNYSISCSGVRETLDVDVRSESEENKFLAKIKMPKFLNMKEIKFENETLILVEFSGIHHFIYEGKEDKKKVIDFARNYLEDKEYLALGLMFFNEKKMEMLPYVYVKGFCKGVWENSCASGTTALGFYLKKYKKIEKAKIIQPNGWLEFSFDEENIYIDGPVEIVAEGKVYI
ncbi:MAG: diaminopimelate epimerase [Fusobacterium sp.]|uniref:histidine racemase n=1 Tax=Fusobacterium sp. TaxID=68766 RepID=UPI0026DC6320|nr:diaminopimelate epimerase [Fusobacterium sp.]MDO4690617.1 diaminopimelate epimerase [Fusobacterium sp.]